jgi:hypothetical protein
VLKGCLCVRRIPARALIHDVLLPGSVRLLAYLEWIYCLKKKVNPGTRVSGHLSTEPQL